MPRNLSPAEITDIHQLRQEIGALGDRFDEESLDRRAQIDRLRLEVAILKKVMTQAIPNFESDYRAAYDELVQTFDPDAGKAI